MRLDDFNYELPEELIAQEPLAERDASRLLVLHRKTGQVEHRYFRDLPEYLDERDRLVFNQSKVVKARLKGVRETGGVVEAFLLREQEPGIYEALVKCTASKKEGLRFTVENRIRAEILRALPGHGTFLVRLEADNLAAAIDAVGRVPLPPYIHRDPDAKDIQRYQTLYASEPGSVAAPTAGLHFTPAMFAALEARGVQKRFVTLHVGLGTFQPIKVENIEEHKMHSEFFHVSEELAKECAEARAKGFRTVAVGTTACRSIESAARGYRESTALYLMPGAEFYWVDALFTNFHQPKSSLVVMVSAFAGSREMILEAYAKAIEEKYRFFSYGDAMLIL